VRARVRAVAQRAAARAASSLERLLDIRSGDPLAADFAHFGDRSRIAHPRRLIVNPQAIWIGSDVEIQAGAVLEAVHDAQELIRIADGCYFGFRIRIVAINGVFLEQGVALGHGVTLADTIHDYKNAEPDGPAWQAPLKVGEPLRIGRGAWIGNNTVVTGGVTLGEGCIIGPNCAITRDVPPYTLVTGGAPRVVRRRDSDGEWHPADDALG
jgi:acetyltransferase-like isoleucine patch superfamily enzyme